MMDAPLSLNHLVERAARIFHDIEVVSLAPSKEKVRHTYEDIYRRSRALAKALQEAGLKQTDRVATMMWNHHAHLETYYGVPMAGGVYHTLNIRLSPKDIIYIANHAEDRFLIVDDSLLKLYMGIKDHVNFERVFVVNWKGGELPEGTEDYEEFLQSGMDDSWTAPEVDERQPAGMCYTSGTTGRPKGVVYDHRSIVLHSFASAMPDMLNLSTKDTLLPVVPMFHANAWGLAFAAAMTGTKQVHPGPHLDPETLLDTYESENVTVSAGVPTIWMGILKLLNASPNKWDIHEGMRMIVGGSAAPESMIRGFDEHDMRIIHAWGMTETAPLGTVSTLKGRLLNASEQEQYDARAKQGYAAPFVELRARAEGELVPRNGESMGELEVRGPWVASSYHNLPEAADSWTDDGWFKTGDVVTIDEEGYMKITDRTKDLVKSGGEWISSVDLENALMAHDSIAEAAVIAIPHEKWQERPLAVVVPAEGKSIDKQALNDFLDERFARYWLPDGYVVMDEIPRGATGKFQKAELREELSGWSAAEDDPGAP
jgi:fatty-acyl-CoA synthase